MQMTGWGRYPVLDAELQRPATSRALAAALASVHGDVIARGNGRSYGDASLAPTMFAMTAFDRFSALDAHSGLLECDAGLRLADILAVVVPRGWFLPILPGTGDVTVGGAIAADVHGKNHHHDGSFSACVESLDLMLADGSQLRCSRHEHADLFHATAGGMGLTGIILAARLRLAPVTSAWLEQRVLAARNLDDALALLEQHAAATYVVAWLDVNQRGADRGRALVMLGEHAVDGGLASPARPARAVPLDLPAGLIGAPTAKLFNALYYRRGARAAGASRVHYAQYFFPLDALRDWNRLYGKRGFVQHQCVLPPECAPRALAEILATVVASGVASPLAVLKGFGPGNDNLLSFPMAGYTLTMDFPRGADTAALCARLDALVVAHGGRIYLAKDASMSAATFRHGYPRWEAFQAVRERYGALARFHSLQSRRLGL